MMLKITERCTMNCSHCMNDAKPDGRDMSLDTLRDSLNFLMDNLLGRDMLILSGGEPTEHREFDKFMDEIIEFNTMHRYFKCITITTNGENIQIDYEKFKDYVKRFKSVGTTLLFQVSADKRYYTRRIDTTKRIFREEGFVLCDNCVEYMYPQGRALQNNYPWQSRGSKCINVRLLAHQTSSFKDIERYLMSTMRFCTPHISIDGSIKLGESDLCPPCATIYEDITDIFLKIRNFQCHGCDHVNKQLDFTVKDILGLEVIL